MLSATTHDAPSAVRWYARTSGSSVSSSVQSPRERACLASTDTDESPVERQQRAGVIELVGDVDPIGVVRVHGQPGRGALRAEARVRRIRPLHRGATLVASVPGRDVDRLDRRQAELAHGGAMQPQAPVVAELAGIVEQQVGHADLLAVVEERRSGKREHERGCQAGGCQLVRAACEASPDPRLVVVPERDGIPRSAREGGPSSDLVRADPCGRQPPRLHQADVEDQVQLVAARPVVRDLIRLADEHPIAIGVDHGTQLAHQVMDLGLIELAVEHPRKAGRDLGLLGLRRRGDPRPTQLRQGAWLRVVGQRRVLEGGVRRIQSEAIDPEIEPEAHDVGDGVPHGRMPIVQVGLFAQEAVVVVLLRRRVELPGRSRRTATSSCSAGSRRAGPARRTSRAWRCRGSTATR